MWYHFVCLKYLGFILVLLHYSSSVFSVFSDSGTFLGLGTVTGSVAIFIAFSLQVATVTITHKRSSIHTCAVTYDFPFVSLASAEAVLHTGSSRYRGDRLSLPPRSGAGQEFPGRQ